MSRGDNIQEILGAIGSFWAKWGLRRVPQSQSFFVVQVNHATFWQFCNSRFLPNLVAKCTSVSRRGIRKDIFKNFHFRGYLPPKSENESRSNRHLTQSRLQVMGCTAERYCLLHVVEFPRSVNFSLRHTIAELRASKLPNFRILAYFPHTKPLKCAFQ